MTTLPSDDDIARWIEDIAHTTLDDRADALEAVAQALRDLLDATQ